MAASRFKTINTEDFLAHNENQNTLKKTLSHVKLLKQFLTEKHQESREIHTIPAAELDRYLSEFVINVCKADGTEYEPSYLRGMISSFDRQLKRHKYGSVIISSAEFADTREALRLKQRHLKSQGKGDKPFKADPLNDSDINKLYETCQLGIYTPTSLINTLWYLNTLHFGIRGGSEEHRQICWGDIQLKHDYATKQDYLEYHERRTKTRTGDDLENMRVCPPRMYAVPEDRDRCPVATYMFYQSKRPDDFCRQDDPFYLAVVTDNKQPAVNARWFLRGPIGKNKIEGIMKKMAEEADLPKNKRFTNTSVRKTLVQKMTDNNVPDTLQVYVTGHNNVGSLNNYRSLSDNHKVAISNILSRTDSSARSFELPSTSSSMTPAQCHAVLPQSQRDMRPQSLSQHRNTSKSFVEGMFAGSTMNNCSININFSHNSPHINPKRKRMIMSDSDTD